MIKITKKDGTQVIEVTSGAYENYYRRLGYVPLEEVDQPTADGSIESPEESQSEDCEDAKFMQAVETKPISKWTNPEMQRYAGLVGIDPKAKNLRDVIKQVIDRRESEEAEEAETNDGH